MLIDLAHGVGPVLAETCDSQLNCDACLYIYIYGRINIYVWHTRKICGRRELNALARLIACCMYNMHKGAPLWYGYGYSIYVHHSHFQISYTVGLTAYTYVYYCFAHIHVYAYSCKPRHTTYINYI